MLGGSGGFRWFLAWQSPVCGKMDKKKREDRFLGLCPGTGLFGIDGRTAGITDSDIQKITLPGRLVMSHEFYNLGHMVEGAIAHYQEIGRAHV